MSEHQDEMTAAIDRVLVTGDFTVDDLTTLRSGLDAFAAAVSTVLPIETVTDELLDLPGRSVPLRTYRPAGAGDAVLVWFHGGGYVSGTIDAIDPVCRELALRLRCTVVSVGYRLAPEFPYPAALDDCLAAVEAVAALTTGPLAVGGDSAGAGLCAAVVRRTTVPVVAQLLLCPWLDATLSCPSVRLKGEVYGLTEAALRRFAAMYIGPEGDHANEGASPLLGKDFSGLPPTVVVTAENDPLCDEGELYALRLVEAGGQAHLRRWDGMVHGFVGMTAELPQAGEALQWSCDRLTELLSPAVP